MALPKLVNEYGFNTVEWYCPTGPMDYRARNLFVPSQPDQATQEFVDRAHKYADGHIYKIIRDSPYYNGGDIGKTNEREYMLSSNQLAKFTDNFHLIGYSWDRKLMNLGATNGDITDNIRASFTKIHVTENNPYMSQMLTNRGFIVADPKKWQNIAKDCHLIMAINKLDCHPDPGSFLHNLYAAAKFSERRLLVSVRLPHHHLQSMHRLTNAVIPGDNKFTLNGRTFEEHVSSLITNLFENFNFRVLKWTKIPYLVEGDATQPLIVSPSALFLLVPSSTKFHHPTGRYPHSDTSYTLTGSGFVTSDDDSAIDGWLRISISSASDESDNARASDEEED